jgi:hypothetical protein
VSASLRYATVRTGFTRGDAVNPSMGAPGAASVPRTAPRMNPTRTAATRWLRIRASRSPNFANLE